MSPGSPNRLIADSLSTRSLISSGVRDSGCAFDESRRHEVGVDVESSQLGGGRLDQSDQARFGRVVTRRPDPSAQPVDRADAHDLAVLLFHEHRGGGADIVERAFQADVDDHVPIGLVHLPNGRAPAGAGVQTSRCRPPSWSRVSATTSCARR